MIFEVPVMEERGVSKEMLMVFSGRFSGSSAADEDDVVTKTIVKMASREVNNEVMEESVVMKEHLCIFF